MRRAFTIQLYDRIDPDVCLRGDCQGPAPSPLVLTRGGEDLIKATRRLYEQPEQCLPCARRRLGLSDRRTSAWWRVEPTEGKQTDYIVCDDLLDEDLISSPAKRAELLDWYENYQRTR